MTKETHHSFIATWIYNRLFRSKGKITAWLTSLFIRCLRGLVHLKLFPASKTRYLPVNGRFKVKFPQKFSIKMEASVHDEIARGLFWEGIASFEYETVRLFIDLARKNRTVFDIGANNGYFGLIAARLNPAIQVFAFEPVPRICQQIRRNAALNQLDNLNIIQAAVSNEDGVATLFVPKSEFPTSASLMESFRPDTEAIHCTTITLDNFVRQNSIRFVDLIKIDTEATEPAVLEGMQKILNDFHPDIICEVLKGRTEERLQALLEPLNYNFYWITDQGMKKVTDIAGDPSYHFKNYLFTTKQF